MNEINATNSQQQAINSIVGQLKGNHMTPSEFKGIDVQGRDKFTGSLRVLINYEQHIARIWIGKRGQIRDLDGMILSQKDNGKTRMVRNPPSVRKR